MYVQDHLIMAVAYLEGQNLMIANRRARCAVEAGALAMEAGALAVRLGFGSHAPQDGGPGVVAEAERGARTRERARPGRLASV